MKQFEINKTYSTRSICDHDCIIEMTILERTAKTIKVKIKNEREIKTLRISKRDSEYFKAETVSPWGKFSMSPMITA